jgi:hypothetical protein
MAKQASVAAALAVAIGLGGLAVTGSASADGIFSLMNPSNWFSGNHRDHDYDHRYWRSGWGGPYGWNAPWWRPRDAGAPTVIVLKGQAQSSAELASVQRPE